MHPSLWRATGIRGVLAIVCREGRSAVFGGPGMVLADGEVAGLWRPSRKGKKLVITVEPLGRLSSAVKGALAAEAARLAPFRGAETAELAYT